MYIHHDSDVYTFLQMYIHVTVCTWYVQGMYIPRYKRVCQCTLFRRASVCTCLYYYVRVLNHINMYIQLECSTNPYIECCVAHVTVQCTDGYIHFMKCTDILVAEPGTYIDVSFWMQLFDSPGWLACHGRLGLAAAWCHAYSSSSTQV